MKIKTLLRKAFLKDIGFAIEKKIQPKFDLINKNSKRKIGKHTFGKKKFKNKLLRYKKNTWCGFFFKFTICFN